MSRQRLIDAESIEYTKFCEAFGNGMYKAVDVVYRTDIDAMPTIDPESLSVVQRLREQNEKLNAGIGNMAENICVAYRQRDKLRDELECVKAERDAAVRDLTFAVNKYRLFTTDINLCYLCKFDFPPAGKNEQTYECPGCYGDDCFEWRGPQKEE